MRLDKAERERVKKLMEQHPVCQRAYRNAYHKAEQQKRPEFERIEAGRRAVLKAHAFIAKQQAL